jgi:hypothetical protein
MDDIEKQLQLDALDIALKDIDKIIDNMTKNNYSKEQISEYNLKRWQIYNKIYQVKRS